MRNGTPLTTGQFARLAGTVIANLPREMESELALDYADNGETLATILRESLTRENLNQKLAALGKKGLLLIPEGTVTVAPSNAPFVARDHFRVNTTTTGWVKIAYLWDNFRDWFLEKAEESFAGSTLSYGKLSRASMDGPIIAELGGETKAETTLAELFALMEQQPNGETGPLLTNGYANVFYIRDVNAVPRAVDVHWRGDGWDVCADAVTNPIVRSGDRQVFSRNS